MPTLDFKGKSLVYAHHLTVPFRPLEPDAAKSLPPPKPGAISSKSAPKSGKPSLDDNLIIHGDNLPDYETLAHHVAYTATGQAPDKINPKTKRGKDGFFFETKDCLFYLIYEPNLAFLRNSDSALNSDRAELITKQAKEKKKTAVVFAAHKFIGQKELSAMGIVCCGLPYWS